LLLHAEILASVLNELVHLLEGAFVEQEIDAFTDGKFAFTVLAFAALGPPTFFSGGVTAPEFIETIHQSSAYRVARMRRSPGMFCPWFGPGDRRGQSGASSATTTYNFEKASFANESSGFLFSIMRKHAAYFAAAALVLCLRPSLANAQRQLTIGIVNGQLDKETTQSFEPFTAYMERRVPGIRFQMVPLATIEDLVQAVERKQLDFAFATPAALVELNVRLGARAIATVLQPTTGGQDYPWLAGAIFVRDSRADIRRLEDVRGKRVIALSPLALGGWLSAVREWRKVGIHEDKDLGTLRFVFSYAKIAQEVCEGHADVGVLAAGALTQVESLCAQKFRVLPSTRGGRDPRYPATISTELYPEEAFAVVGAVPETLVSQIEIALLAIEPDSAVARAATVAGFTAPLSYAPVQQLMEELRLRPFESYGRLGFRQALEQHWPKVLMALLGFLLVLGWALVRTRQLNARLRISEGFRKRVFEGSHVPVVVMDAATGQYVDCNPAAVAIYGFSSQAETVAKTLLDVSAPLQYDGGSSQERIQRHFEKALREGKAVFDWRHRRPDGVIWDARIHLMSFESDHRRLLQFTLEDVTLRKRAEADRSRLEEQLRQSQKMESIGRMAGGIAHDFNNLLTVINGYAEMLLQGKKLDEPARQPVAQIFKAGEQAKDLTRQLLAFSRRQILQPVLLDLNQLIRDSEAMFGRLLGEDIRFVLDLDPSLGPVMADRGQIHQVLMNLVVNARDAMPQGGVVTVSTTEVQREIADPPGEIAAGVYCLIEVSDTGVGIDPAIREHIFEPFFSTKGQAGTGLGLSTVYGIVRQSQGGIAVVSEPGSGTAFRVYLPRNERLPEPAPARELQPVSLKGSATVLLVEDEDDVRRFAGQVLSGGGYRVLEAATGEAAIRIALDHEEPIQLLLTDVVLHGMNGMQLAERYLKLHPESSALFTSGYPDDVMAFRRVFQGGVAFIAKPYSPDELLGKVADVLNVPKGASRAAHH
jgi:two-component system, cell cycle sensor histidine kinase and response regulator CckA